MIKPDTYLDRRWKDESSINLYHCADEDRGIFVERDINDDQGQTVILRSFINSVPLEEHV